MHVSVTSIPMTTFYLRVLLQEATKTKKNKKSNKKYEFVFLLFIFLLFIFFSQEISGYRICDRSKRNNKNLDSVSCFDGFMSVFIQNSVSSATTFFQQSHLSTRFSISRNGKLSSAFRSDSNILPLSLLCICLISFFN